MFRITTLNVNGIRSAAKKGVFRWLTREAPDVVCLQEVRADECDIPAGCRLRGLNPVFHCAHKRGYSGTALYSVRRPREVRCGFGSAEFDTEGRYVEAQFKDVTVISAYFPSGSSGPHRQQAKYRFLGEFLPHLDQLVASGREVILCGDINIAHREIDLKNWRGNRNHSGFLPDERAWMSQLFDEHGWVDVFRTLDPRPDRYTWWSNFGQAYAKNVGWRIDYQIATPGVAKRARSADIYVKRRFSDHAPLTIAYTGSL
ncbi:MAG: exodeoxyribonuclease III [Burkholderiaceae bacterium]|nr:exodeoxyribonuclease III [Burkholderiaceae bacterium]